MNARMSPGRQPTSKHHILISLLIAAWLGVTSLTGHASNNLPLMGEPADRAMSPEEEQRIGRQFMRYARAQLDPIKDPQIRHYLQQLGERLLAGGVSSDMPYHFFMLDNPTINAFATPGGYIGIHSGLMIATSTESQLAGVMAHEIAHVHQRHIARAIANNSNSELATMAAIIAAILIAQNDPQAGQAALTGGIAASQQSSIDFTRAHEAEADSIGMHILTQAGFAPSGMVEFFGIMQQQASLNGEIPYEFLRTHPLSSSRLAEAQARTESLESSELRRDSIEFQLMRGRLEVLMSDNLPALSRQLKRRLADAPKDIGLQYASALAALRLHQASRAEALTNAALTQSPHSVPWLMLSAQIEAKQGELASALNTLHTLAQLYPHYYPAIAEYAYLQSSHGNPQEAESRLMEYLREQRSPTPSAWQLLARIRLEHKKSASSAEALANYYLGIDEPSEALTQLKLALSLASDSEAMRTRLTARIDSLKSSGKSSAEINARDG